MQNEAKELLKQALPHARRVVELSREAEAAMAELGKLATNLTRQSQRLMDQAAALAQLVRTAAAWQEGENHWEDLEGDEFLLRVPYLSQSGAMAERGPGDCGPACIAMAVHFLTEAEPTVDEVSVAAGMPEGGKWTNFGQLAAAAKEYGLRAEYIRPLKREMIESEIQLGIPVLALVKYDLLSTDDDPNQDSFRGAHFVLIVGFSPTMVIFHDSDRLRGDEFGAFRRKSWAVFERAHSSTSKTAGNTRDFHGMTFEVVM